VPLGTAAAVPGTPAQPVILNPGNLPIDVSTQGELVNLTVRQAVRVSVGGARLRLRFTNEGGVAPLSLGAVRVGLAGPDGTVIGGGKAVTFDGAASSVAPPGSPLISDPIDLPTRALDKLYVSIFLPAPATRDVGTTWSYVAGQRGDFTAAASLPGAKLMGAPALVSQVMVEPARPTNVVVTLGDSITEGATSTTLAFRSYPDRLAERLAAAGANWSVVNVGIGGNRLLRQGAGPSALARLDRDVLSVPGVKAIILMEGINDIGRGNIEPVTAEALIAADKQIIARAHAKGIRVIGATLTPYKGAAYATEAGEQVRQALNRWISTGGAFDGVIDFATPVADRADPLSFGPGMNTRDHLHPNDAGYKAMADSIDLSVVTGTRGR
jgi:lysophospholipase L1-like esterase